MAVSLYDFDPVPEDNEDSRIYSTFTAKHCPFVGSGKNVATVRSLLPRTTTRST